MRKVLPLLCALGAVTAAQAHFVFVVPAKSGATAAVVFSEDLEPDEAVEIGKVAGLKLTSRDAAGKDVPVAHKADKHALIATLPGAGTRVVFGSVNYGVLQKGQGKPYLLAYHPKALIGVGAEKITLGDAVPAELLALAEGGKVRFKLVARGKPVPGADVTVIKPDGSKVKVKTAADGLTDAVDGSGRFGAWTRVTEARTGEQAGKKYEEVRHYPTLVADIGG